jgi:hypothetical protein
MLTPRLRVGERVKLRVATTSVQAGTPGTVHWVYYSTLDTYEVVFDTRPSPYIVTGSELERVAETTLLERTV